MVSLSSAETLHALTCVRVYVSMYESTCICIWVCTYLCTCVPRYCMYMYMCVRMYVCVCGIWVYACDYVMYVCRWVCRWVGVASIFSRWPFVSETASVLCTYLLAYSSLLLLDPLRFSCLDLVTLLSSVEQCSAVHLLHRLDCELKTFSSRNAYRLMSGLDACRLSR